MIDDVLLGDLVNGVETLEVVLIVGGAEKHNLAGGAGGAKSVGSEVSGLTYNHMEQVGAENLIGLIAEYYIEV